MIDFKRFGLQIDSIQMVKSAIPASLRHIRSKISLINSADLYKENLGSRWTRALKFVAAEMSGREIRFKSPDGLLYVSMPNNYSSFVTCVAGARDPEIWRFIKSTLSSGSVFVDAGANIGTYTLPASKLVGIGGKVISFEAHPRTFAYLERNLAINKIDNVKALNLALGSENGSVSMDYDFNNPGETRIADKLNDLTAVRMTTIDDELDRLQIGEIDYLKIDVEGFELPVLLGARNILLRSRRAIVQTELEERHAARYGYNTSEIRSLLESLGFSPYKIAKCGKAYRLGSSMTGDVIWIRS